jgi:small-conductance mechanosensitive channel
LTEKMSGFELKLNYVLLRQTKSNKRKSTLHHQDSIKSRTRQTYLKKLMNSKARIVIYLLLILILFYIILSNLSEFLLVGNELDY